MNGVLSASNVQWEEDRPSLCVLHVGLSLLVHLHALVHEREDVAASHQLLDVAP